MTAQVMEQIVYQGKKVGMATEPLSQYIENEGPFQFDSPSTACWRGYLGTWEVINKKLFLIDFKGFIHPSITIGLNYLFQDDEKVHASWFTGEIRIPRGSILYYAHGGYDSIYEEDVILCFDKGILHKEFILNNEEKAKMIIKQDKDLPF